MLIAIDSSMALVELNPTTGARTPIVTVTGAANIQGLAYDKQLDILYGAANGNDSLYRINMTTGAATLIGAFGVGDIQPHGLEYDDSTGALYMGSSTNGTFYSVNKTTGQATAIGVHGLVQNTNFGYNSNSDVMYATNSSTDSFYTVNRATGALTLVGALGGGSTFPNALAFNYNTNVMYMTDTTTDSLYTINLATGAATLIGSTTVGNLQGLAYINPVPEPGTLMAVSVGMIGLCLTRRKR
jgi:6-phosphogluconolactonase (cycloisomerase 2 family)